MNILMNALLKPLVRPASIVVFGLLVVKPGLLYGQTFKLQDREYRLIEGRWWNFSTGERGDQIVPDRMIVRLKNRGDLRRFDFARFGMSNVTVISDELFGGYYVVKVLIPQDPFAVASFLSKDALVDYVEFDGPVEYHGTPSDPLYSNQWNLRKISTEAAWDVTTGSNSVILAIIDSGIDYLHEDLDGNLWRNTNEISGQQGIDDDNNGYVDDFYGWDFYDNDNSPLDGFRHGTAVAGIAVAQANNYESGAFKGVAGISGGWGASKGAALMVLRIDDRGQGSGRSSAMQCLRYAANNGAKVVNMSFGWSTDYQFVREAIDSAANVYGCLVVASAGNNGGDESTDRSVRWPARYPAVIAVGATVENDSRWVTSGGEGSAIGSELDVMAPGGASIICHLYCVRFPKRRYGSFDGI